MTRADILRRAEAFEARHVLEPYYLEPDDGETFCETCVRREAKETGSDVWIGDRSANHDSPPTCDRCQRWLEGWLTDWGARQELQCLEDDFNPRRGQDCWLWMLCENSFLRDSEEYRRLLALLEKKPCPK